MTAEWKTGIHEEYRTKVIRVGNATIEIHRPILTDDERNKRENQVIDALKGFGKGIKEYERI
jgi:hypothetical protein